MFWSGRLRNFQGKRLHAWQRYLIQRPGTHSWFHATRLYYTPFIVGYHSPTDKIDLERVICSPGCLNGHPQPANPSLHPNARFACDEITANKHLISFRSNDFEKNSWALERVCLKGVMEELLSLLLPRAPIWRGARRRRGAPSPMNTRMPSNDTRNLMSILQLSF